ncbi:hypothetical protein [Streptomyces rimosus]|uniref:hypothetical protein n=1 Tax=Streptomyces rimosus TaxID=1927 RepID=UPI0004C0085D|nr:hypothetical protein [Streptomyces rimosus]
MDTEHGDDFGTWVDGHSGVRSHTPEQWLQLARFARQAANKLGEALPLCLPGEPRECGRDGKQHALAWAALVKARAHHLIETTAPTAAQAAFCTGPLYQRHLTELREKAQVEQAKVQTEQQ